MKISRYGSRHYSSNSGSFRVAEFRKKYTVGQILQGKLLKWEQPKLGWVEINSQTLLANILSSPNPGDQLTFLVQQLYPDIILKEVNPDDLANGGHYLNPADVTRTFVAKRAAFEAQSRSIINKTYSNSKLTTPDKLTFFLKTLESDTKSLILFFETLKCVSTLNSALKSASLHYMPWIMPLALNQEIVLKVKRDSQNDDNSFYELFYAFDHRVHRIEPMRFKIMYKKPQCGFKLLTDSRNISLLLSSEFKINFSEFLGVEKIPVHCVGGFLSELLGSS